MYTLRRVTQSDVGEDAPQVVCSQQDVHERDQAGVRHGKPVGVNDVVAVLGVAENLQHLLVDTQVDAHALRSALLVRGGDGGKHGIPRLAWLVPRSHSLARLGVHDRRVVVGRAILTLHEQLARAVAQQLVEANLHLERRLHELVEHRLVLVRYERDAVLVAASRLHHQVHVNGLRHTPARTHAPPGTYQHVPERHVLESLRLADLVVVGDVDASRDTGGAKRHHLQRRKVGAVERILFELRGPWQEGQKRLCGVHQRLKFGGHGLVDHGHEALPLAAHTARVTVGLDEADV